MMAFLSSILSLFAGAGRLVCFRWSSMGDKRLLQRCRVRWVIPSSLQAAVSLAPAATASLISSMAFWRSEALIIRPRAPQNRLSFFSQN